MSPSSSHTRSNTGWSMCRLASGSDWSRQKREKGLGCEFGEPGLDLLTAGEVVAAVEVAEFVQVAQAA